nr:PD-(D/E)XK nuclease family protein [uncultured Prevotella sp.]
MKETLRISNLLFQYRLNYYKNGIRLSERVHQLIKTYLDMTPFHLNVIEAACRGRFKETGHSLVLANLLKHPVIQSSFIKNFLNIQHEYMHVTAEKNRIDVALKGKDIFVIIENKVNDAEEMENQIYRYVNDIGIKKYGFTLPQIYVLYLNPTNRTLPSPYSLCDKNKENNVFEALEKEHFKVLSYKYDITDWLRKLSIENEPHIASALDQYIDFLENKFYTSPIYQNMNKEIKDFILKELHIEGLTLQEQITALKNEQEKVTALLDSIESLRIELRKEESNRLMREWQSEIEKEISLSQDEHSFGIQLKNQVWLGVWDGYDAKNNLPYWGFQLENYKKIEMPDLLESIKKLIEKSNIEHYHTDEKDFIAWCTTNEGVSRFLSLYEAAKESGML